MVENVNRLLRRQEVEQIAGFNKSTLYDFIRQGRFPAPVRVGARAVRWRETDILRWLDGLPPARAGGRVARMAPEPEARRPKSDPEAAEKVVDNPNDLPKKGVSNNVEFKNITSLRPYERNARVHSKKQISQIAKSIKTFGFLNPIVIDAAGTIIAGHGRFEAAKLLGLRVVPMILAEHLTEAQKRAYALADNKIAENATWDKSLLKIELSELLEISNEVEINVTGFATPEIDLLINPVSSDLPEPPTPFAPKNPVTVERDLWHLGRHRVLCGDATLGESFNSLLRRRRARLVFTDPPYNVHIKGHARGRSQAQHQDFAMASGEMTSVEFQAFLRKTLRFTSDFCRDGSLHYICMDWRHMSELLGAADGIYSDLKNLCVWNKNVGGMGSFYRSKHELVFVFKKGKARHVNNVDLGRFGRNRSNVWDYPGVGSFGKDRKENLSLHPTVKPLALVADVMMDASHRADLVLDPFLGSGTTILAAEQTGRIAYGLEIDPGYVDVILKRWWAFTGIEPIHGGSGLTFSEIRKTRKSKPREGYDHAVL